MIKEFNLKGYADNRWSVGNRKKSIEGRTNYFFLFRQSVEPKGIVGFGMITKEPYESAPWRKKDILSKKKANYVNVRYEFINETPILNREYLIDIFNNSEKYWNTQVSGIQIPDEIGLKIREYCLQKFHQTKLYNQ